MGKEDDGRILSTAPKDHLLTRSYRALKNRWAETSHHQTGATKRQRTPAMGSYHGKMLVRDLDKTYKRITTASEELLRL